MTENVDLETAIRDENDATKRLDEARARVRDALSRALSSGERYGRIAKRTFLLQHDRHPHVDEWIRETARLRKARSRSRHVTHGHDIQIAETRPPVIDPAHSKEEE